MAAIQCMLFSSLSLHIEERAIRSLILKDLHAWNARVASWLRVITKVDTPLSTHSLKMRVVVQVFHMESGISSLPALMISFTHKFQSSRLHESFDRSMITFWIDLEINFFCFKYFFSYMLVEKSFFLN